LETLRITRLGSGGEGIADHLARRVEVPFALPGETVTARIEGDRALSVSLLQTSRDRTAPPCPHFGRCGGCAAQHMATGLYREWKRSLVDAALVGRGHAAGVGDMIDAHGDGRRRVAIHVRKERDPLAGFMAARSHHLVDIDRCPLLVGSLADAFTTARALAGLALGRVAFDLHLTAAENGIDADLRGLEREGRLAVDAVAAVARAHHLIRVGRHGDVLYQSERPYVTCGSARVEFPPGAFLQATAAAEKAISDLVLGHASRARRIADLFCGIGPFALRLAERVPVSAFDADRGAIAALASAAARTPGLRPVSATVRDLFRNPLTGTELEGMDTAVVNPPRQGAEAQCRQLAGAGLRTVIMVSCNPATFARDADILVRGGYRLEVVTPVDQFLWSPHVELVALFVKLSGRRA
jgi:23S rRNA (uracil1939-C5)-methyltransferase